jgi:hypothetical protein
VSPAALGDVLQRHDIVDVVFNALSAVMFPSSVFWNLWPSITAHAAEATVRELLVDKFPPASWTLADISRRVESSSGPLLEYLDSLIAQIRDWTGGLGVVAIPQAGAAASAEFSRRITAMMREEESLASRKSAAVDWSRVSGALRLLSAVSSLKSSWEAAKESGIAAAAGTASNLIEDAESGKSSPSSRISMLIEHADARKWTEASASWQLAMDESFTQRLTKTFELIGTASDDFQDLISQVHLLVYNSMFKSIRQRLETLTGEEVWKEDGSDDAQESSVLSYSSSPLLYATDVADYLMTIPQQLEPFVPNDDSQNIYLAPPSIYTFSPNEANRRKAINSLSGAAIVDEDSGNAAPDNFSAVEGLALETNEMNGVSDSFAGMWIGAVAVGTMEMYVQHILAIPRLGVAGARQLATDIEYICNVLAALGVSPTKELELVLRCVECAPDRTAYDVVMGDLGNSEYLRLCRRVAALRGLTVPA